MSSSKSSSVRSSNSSSRESVSTGPSSVESATISKPKYADEHYPLISSINPGSVIKVPTGIPKTHMAFVCASKMAAIHNTMIRALNASYNHAPSVTADTPRCKDFLHFNQVLCTMLDHHHETEDNFLFPAWEEMMGRSGGMEENVKGHEAFMEGFHAFQKYVSDPASVSHFDAIKHRENIEWFAPELIQHLHNEIPTILSLYTHEDSAMKKIWEQADKMATSGVDMHTFGPIVLGCQDKTFLIDGEIPDFPGMPWIAEYLVRKWYARRYSGVWDFCPSDLQGQRRLLPA